MLALSLSSIVILTALAYHFTALSGTPGNVVGNSPAFQPSQSVTPLPPIIANGRFHEYPLPQTDSEVMPPTIDHEGRLWFGEMGKNALAVFDPRTQTFRQMTPPRGNYSIMGVQVAQDDTIWFAEQDANYIGHYIPGTGRFQIYPLPEIPQPASNNAGTSSMQASAPNELAFDTHGNLWFTEFNADALGWLDTHTGHMRHYPLPKSSVGLKLAPFGIAIDPEGMIWFTGANSNQFGRFDPLTGQFRFFSWQGSHEPFKEIASDASGTLWLTTFTSNLLLRFNPSSGAFVPYHAPSLHNQAAGDSGYGLAGLAVSPKGDVWITDPAENVIARLDIATQRFTYYSIPTQASLPLGIVLGANHTTLWFTEVNKIGLLEL